jgi:hypothetical protein
VTIDAPPHEPKSPCAVGWTATKNALAQFSVEMKPVDPRTVKLPDAIPQQAVSDGRYRLFEETHNAIRLGPGNSGSPLYTRNPDGTLSGLIGLASFQLGTPREPSPVVGYTNLTGGSPVFPAKATPPTNTSASTDNTVTVAVSGTNAGIIPLPCQPTAQTLTYTDNDTAGPRGELLVKHVLLRPQSQACRLSVSVPQDAGTHPKKPYVTVLTFPQFTLVTKTYADGPIVFPCEKGQSYLVRIEVLKRDLPPTPVAFSVTAEEVKSR